MKQWIKHASTKKCDSFALHSARLSEMNGSPENTEAFVLVVCWLLMAACRLQDSWLIGTLMNVTAVC
jgi:hypothetical protein